ncbi:MAG TPA: glycosyltransferase family 4 protein [Gemmatimonadaceae bacterium]|nr:glycosyltransferase family 4 protein [Gemmatimonadaceae bacterium]
MRALFLIDSPAWSGSSRVFTAVARGLASRGYSVTIVCRPESAVEQRSASLGLEVVPVDLDGRFTAAARRLRRVIEDRFVEVVFVHGEREALVAGWAVRTANRGAIVRRARVEETLTNGWRAKLGARVAATGFVFPSDDELRRSPPLPPRALGAVLADVGVDVPAFDAIRPAPRASFGAAGQNVRVIACVYDPTARARVATVFRTIGLLAPRHPELRLVLLGPGSDDEALRMHAAALGITPMVSYLGDRDDRLAILRAADLGWVVASSDDAAYGYLDLMALRVPVLADRSDTAQRYVADGIGGLLLPPGDAPGTAAIVTTFLADAERREAMGNAAYGRVARAFTERAMVDAFARVTDAARDRSRWVT